jgi:hypothetical protein
MKGLQLWDEQNAGTAADSGGRMDGTRGTGIGMTAALTLEARSTGSLSELK